MAEAFRVLVCGGRDYADKRTLYRALDALLAKHRTLLVINGGAKGADRFSEYWADEKGQACMVFHPAWTCLRAGAGHVRNGWMLEYGKPDLVLAFPGGAGTHSMVTRSRRAGVEVLQVEGET